MLQTEEKPEVQSEKEKIKGYQPHQYFKEDKKRFKDNFLDYHVQGHVLKQKRKKINSLHTCFQM